MNKEAMKWYGVTIEDYKKWCEENGLKHYDKDSKKKGIGKKLYNEIEKRLKDMGIKNLYSLVVFPPCKTKYLDTNSYDFHRHLGFTEVGHLNKCGMKFGEYFDIVYMERILGVSTK